MAVIAPEPQRAKPLTLFVQTFAAVTSDRRLVLNARGVLMADADGMAIGSVGVSGRCYLIAGF